MWYDTQEQSDLVQPRDSALQVSAPKKSDGWSLPSFRQFLRNCSAKVKELVSAQASSFFFDQG
jgi:hypothetical protein